MKSSPPTFLAITLKEERQKAGLTQKGLAQATGLGLKTIRKIEQDDPSVLMANVNLLLHFFGLELGPHKLMTSPQARKKIPLNRDKILQLLRGVFPIFKAKYGITELGLFGSFARGDADPHSDIDILFEGDTRLTTEGEMSLVLEHLFAGHRVDFTRKARIDPRLKDSILEDVIYV